MKSVIHNPLGLEHPYEQLPEERFPRFPLAGQSFTVGIVTRPVGAIKQVTLHSMIDGEPQASISASLLSDWHPELEEGVGAEYLERIIRIEQDVWQAQLTAPPLGKTLSYWIETDDLKTESFDLVGEDWRAGGGIQFDAEGLMTVSQEVLNNEASERSPKKIEWLTDGKQARRVRLTFSSPSDERFYGLGERFNALNQRGQIMDIRCFEQYKNQGKRSYMPIPFLLSSTGYGVWVQSSRWMQFDLASSQSDTWVLEADIGEDETLTMQWYCGDDPFTVIGQFTTETGPLVLPPDWAFGLWMSGNEWNTQAKIMQEVEASLAHGIQPSVIVIEAWSDETTFYIWNDAEYEPVAGDQQLKYDDFTFPENGKWTDPKGMIDWLHENNVKILLWQVPILKEADHDHVQHDADRAYYEDSGFGVHNADGTVHRIRPFWFRGGYLWDVTNPAERDWWFAKRAYLLDELGIDGFKTDGGEHLWGEDVTFADGRNGSEVWNEYPKLYTSAYYEFANQFRESVTFSRAGFTGSQTAPLHWAGDENSTWEAYRHSILAGLSAGISGISFWGWDLGGFSGEIPSAELYLRATAMATFCPVMQYHSEYNAHRSPSHDRTPWNIQERTGNEQVVDIFRYFMEVRQQLMPYILEEAQFSAETGQPMMRALELIDSQASTYDYLFGRDLLVSPIVEPDVDHSQVHLPAGKWRSLWSNEVYTGEQIIDIDVPLNRIPVFVRESRQLPIFSNPIDQE